MGVGGTVAVGAGGVYSKFIGSKWARCVHRKFQVGARPLAKPLKVLHASDFHASAATSLDFIGKVIDMGLAQKPDLICLTGDFVNEGRHGDFGAYARVLSRLAQCAPTYACLGNNDGAWRASDGAPRDTRAVRTLLQSSGIELLDNASVKIERNGSPLCIAGVGDAYSDTFDQGRAFAAIPKDRSSPVIALCHNPDWKTGLAGCSFDLLLSGHTHGGQVCLPIIGPLYLSVTDRRFVAGLYRWQNRWLHVTRGVGSWYGIRFNCRPEVNLLELT